MVTSQWRLRRIWMMQTAALDLKMDQQEDEIKKRFHQIDQPTRLTVAFTSLANDEKSLDTLLRYETTYTRMYQRALNTLLRLRRETEETKTEDIKVEETSPESTKSEELRNDPSGPLPLQKFAEITTKSQLDAREPRPESTD